VVRKTLKLFLWQLSEYFGNLDTSILLPRLGENEGEGQSSITSSLMPGGKMGLSDSENPQAEEAQVMAFITQLLQVERLLFCPLVRAFLMFDDKSARHDEREGGLEHTLNCRRTMSYWKQDKVVEETKQD